MLLFSYPHKGDMKGANKMQHKHDEQSKKAVVNRLSRAIGHLESVKQMVIDDEDPCTTFCCAICLEKYK